MKCDPLPGRIFAQNSARTSMCYLVEPFKGARGILKSVEKQGIPEVLGLEADYTKMVRVAFDPSINETLTCVIGWPISVPQFR